MTCALALLPCIIMRWLQKYIPLIEKLPPKSRYLMHRALDNWKYGAGKDYEL